ncbi:MAG: hypothetical protein HY555_05270 [Euryarchaeota archaeon]|nr:hypothetical protein [Euryarchaeota archaeon]
MFNITDPEVREKKLKLIEILLIVGGIIGGLRIKEDDPMNTVFGLFLLMSIVYYLMVSNPKKNVVSTAQKAIFAGIAVAIGISFSAIALVPCPPRRAPLHGLRILDRPLPPDH